MRRAALNGFALRQQALVAPARLCAKTCHGRRLGAAMAVTPVTILAEPKDETCIPQIRP